MVPIYAARIEDLGLGDFVQIECACGHVMLLAPQMLATAGVSPDQKVLDLQSRVRCRECDARGRAVVSIKWGKGLTELVSDAGRSGGRGGTSTCDNMPRLGCMLAFLGRGHCSVSDAYWTGSYIRLAAPAGRGAPRVGR